MDEKQRIAALEKRVNRMGCALWILGLWMTGSIWYALHHTFERHQGVIDGLSAIAVVLVIGIALGERLRQVRSH